MQPVPNNFITDPNQLEQIVLHKVKSVTAARGELVLPCVPSLYANYIEQIEDLLRALGQNFTPKERDALRQVIATRLKEGFTASPYARLIFRYEPPDPTIGLTAGLRIQVNTLVPSTEEKYQRWVQTREGPLFGSHPDAKVMAIASQFPNPNQTPVLDVGSGPGRNTLPLAKLGFPVDAIELAPVFAEQLQAAATKEGLPIKVTQADVLNSNTKIRPAHYQFIVVAEVISHFRSQDQVRLLLARMGDALQSGGLLLFSTFLAIDGYEPTEMIRELSQVAWSYLITPQELQSLMVDLPLAIIANESTYDYEQQHLPSEAFPPTKWFRSWATGRDLFPTNQHPPMSLRWILCRRK